MSENTEATTTDASREIDEKTTFSNNRKSFENPRAEKSWKKPHWLVKHVYFR